MASTLCLLSLASFVSLWGLLALAGLLIVPNAPARRAAGVVVGLGVALTPLIAPASWPAVRGAIGVAAFVGVARVIDLARSRRAEAATSRIWHALSMVDSWKTHRAEPLFEGQRYARAVLWTLPTLAAFYVVHEVSTTVGGTAGWLVRWTGGLVFAYCLSEVAYLVLAASYRLCGLVTPELHRTPIASRSVQEFWGQRWNRTIGSWLRHNCFLPLARLRHPRTGLACAFLISAVGHAYLVMVTLGTRMAVWMLAFFLVQGAFVLLEITLRVTKWPRFAAHTWVILAMAASSPLFVEPTLRVAGATVLPP